MKVKVKNIYFCKNVHTCMYFVIVAIQYPRYMILTIQLKLFSEDTKWPQ